MDARACLSEEEVAAWVDGGASASERAAWAGHLESCAACRERLSAGLGDGDVGAAFDPDALEAAVTGAARSGSAPRRTAFAGAWRFAAAASVLLAAGWLLFRSGDAPARHFTLPEGRRVGDVPQDLVAEAFTLPDGSRARLDPGSRARLLAPGTDERVVIGLARGTLTVEAVKDPRAFRVVSEAGEIRVVGTSFSARAFHVWPEAGDAFSVLSVEVSEGAVEFRGAAGMIRVPAGKRAMAFPGRPPALQEMALWDWKTAVARLASGHGKPGFAESLEAVTLLAGTWGGGGDWRSRAADAAATPRERRVAAFLAGLLEEPE